MMGKLPQKRTRNRSIAAADVGRYLKQLAQINRDPLTGNVAMSEALLEIASILLAGKSASAKVTLENFTSQTNFAFEDEIDFQHLPLTQVREILSRTDLTKFELSTIGTERFGIAKSRMDRAPREEILKMIESAMQHEESLQIIAEEAQRQARTS